MIHDRAPEGSGRRYDVGIIGGGPAGIVLALRLARDPALRIVLFESGGHWYEPEAQDLARGQVIGQPYMPLHESRIRALGGSTWSYGGINTVADPLAFEPRPWVEGAWPVSSAVVDPYLGEALELMGIPPAARAATDAAAEAVRAAWPLDPARIAPVPVHFSRPLRFGDAYRDALAALSNVDVFLHSTVTKLAVEEGRVTAVEGLSRRRAFSVEAREFVLAGGGIENPRQLMLAGLGGPTVGRYFMEHPRVKNRYSIRSGATPLYRLLARGLFAGQRPFARLETTAAFQRDERILSSHVNLRFGSIGQRDHHWASVRRLLQASRSPWNEAPFFHDAGGGRMRRRSADLGEALRRPDKSAIGLVGTFVKHPALVRFLEMYATIEQPPLAENHIELGPNLDAVGMPRTRLYWTVGEAETRTYRRTRDLVLEELERVEPGLRHAKRDVAEPWPEDIVGNWHHVGTTRMHDDPIHGVVDRDCRVHGIANLHVAGSSIFPISMSTSPTLLIVQFALRLADHLGEGFGAAPTAVVRPMDAVAIGSAVTNGAAGTTASSGEREVSLTEA